MDEKRDDNRPGGRPVPLSLPEAVDDLIRHAAEELGLDPEETLRALREGRPLAPPEWLERRRRRVHRERLERIVLLVVVAVLLIILALMHWLARAG
jgi:cytoskeletal protein RodZ